LRKFGSDLDRLKLHSKFRTYCFIWASRQDSYFAIETNCEYKLAPFLRLNLYLYNLEYIIILFC